MKKYIVIHATETPSDMEVTLDVIAEMRCVDRYSDPMPYHYIVNVDGRVLKGRRDNELCGHCGRFSRESLSVAFAGEVSDSDCPMSEVQKESMRMLLKNLTVRHQEAEVVGANELLHPDEDPTVHEPFFDVRKWLESK